MVNLTEWPTAILGSFDPEFLELPEEILVTVMRDHQKYFAIEDSNGKLLSHFLAVLNTDGDPGGIVRHGHERVLRARFNDARFFWRADQKHPLRERVQWLKTLPSKKIWEVITTRFCECSVSPVGCAKLSARTVWPFAPA